MGDRDTADVAGGIFMEGEMHIAGANPRIGELSLHQDNDVGDCTDKTTELCTALHLL